MFSILNRRLLALKTFYIISVMFESRQVSSNIFILSTQFLVVLLVFKLPPCKQRLLDFICYITQYTFCKPLNWLHSYVESLVSTIKWLNDVFLLQISLNWLQMPEHIMVTIQSLYSIWKSYVVNLISH